MLKHIKYNNLQTSQIKKISASNGGHFQSMSTAEQPQQQFSELSQSTVMPNGDGSNPKQQTAGSTAGESVQTMVLNQTNLQSSGNLNNSLKKVSGSGSSKNQSGSVVRTSAGRSAAETVKGMSSSVIRKGTSGSSSTRKQVGATSFINKASMMEAAAEQRSITHAKHASTVSAAVPQKKSVPQEAAESSQPVSAAGRVMCSMTGGDGARQQPHAAAATFKNEDASHQQMQMINNQYPSAAAN